MYRLHFIQFLRSQTCQLSLLLILILGGISIGTGKQFLAKQQKVAGQIIEKQADHIARNVELHGDDLPLLLYYLKFNLLNSVDPLAGLSIGQKDLNSNVQSITILTLEGQKYDTDLVNPTKLLYGNLDLSFLIIYIFPLLIIAFTYNLYSEENESGTWRIVNVMAPSKIAFLLSKLSVRLLVLSGVLLLLLLTGAVALHIPMNASFLLFSVTALSYLLFWFALCFAIVSLQLHSNVNALSLLSIWLLLLVLFPAFLNNYITTKYPVPEALSSMIEQRDGYHNKWDTNKKETLELFYREYPQFAKYGFPPEEGFNWGWYYAMQHLGDVEAHAESTAMQEKLRIREKVSKRWARIIPSIHTQLALNTICNTGLINHLKFLEYTDEFHEKMRLYFYPKIFEAEHARTVQWTKFKPEYFDSKVKLQWNKSLLPLLLTCLLFVAVAWVQIVRRF